MTSPSPTADLYAASCNPARKAKQATSSKSLSASANVAPVNKPLVVRPPKGAPEYDVPMDEATATPVATPAKRGRKPGPLSRAAREAQRRLNHSIIEKARRTKINDALATLRELVPLHYGQTKSPVIDPVDSDAEVDPDDYTPASSNRPTKSAGKGKRPEKEKEFKLEILIRTVAYMKDLVTRVAELEKQVALGAGEGGQDSSDPPMDEGRLSRKRRHSFTDEPNSPPRRNRPRRDDDGFTHEPPLHFDVVDRSNPSSPTYHPGLEGPLPSISSWLPDTVIDPRLRGPKQGQPPMETSSYLPSPPSSTQFEPVRSSYLPPTLSLASFGHSSSSSASSSSSSSGHNRTPEDENAAALLVQMSTSPRFRPESQSSSSGSGPGRSNAVLPPLGDPSKMALNPDGPILNRELVTRSNSSDQGRGFHAQTPAKLLGLNHLWTS